MALRCDDPCMPLPGSGTESGSGRCRCMHAAQDSDGIDERSLNLLGAMTLALTDRMGSAMTAASGRGPAATAAIVSLLGWPGRSVDGLRQALGLSHSATVRLIDRLEAEGLVRRVRRDTDDARIVSLALSARGKRLAVLILQARRDALSTVLAGSMSPAEAGTLTGYAVRLLADVARRGTPPRALCRVCDLAACGACPVVAGGPPEP